MLQVKYTLYRDRPIEERRAKFYSSCKDGHIEVVSKNINKINGTDKNQKRHINRRIKASLQI